MVKELPSVAERMALRSRPEGLPIMHQTWGKLLFAHWRIPVELLRPKIPARLEIDTFEGEAWIGITPFTLWNVRPVAVPPIPGLSSFHECNVRTYVHLDGVPGVWFFSLDASKAIPALAARLFYGLNYLKADIDLAQHGNRIQYSLARAAQEHAKEARLEAEWEIGDALPPAEPASREFFLTERYALYAKQGGRLLSARIFHPSWDLRAARLVSWQSTLLGSHDLPEPEVPPLVHYSECVDVSVWPPKEV